MSTSCGLLSTPGNCAVDELVREVEEAGEVICLRRLALPQIIAEELEPG